MNKRTCVMTLREGGKNHNFFTENVWRCTKYISRKFLALPVAGPEVMEHCRKHNMK